MGIIYLAEDRKQGNSPCVVKQLISKYSDSEEHEEAVRLFKREADLLKRFNHPGIVRFFDDHTTTDGKYFLVMDYVPGKNLESIVSTYGPFNSEATVEIAIQCCEVLEYLHDEDPPIIYRDLKPSNLMLTPEGQIVFIDFGIARTFMPKQSATRVVTAGYSPPEQYFGKPETRSDLYALGATLGHLLTGQRPKPLSVSAPRHYNKQVLLTLDDLVRRLTAHNPQDRPFSARDVRHELYRIYHEIHPDFDVPEEALLEKQYASGSFPNLRHGVMMDTASWAQNWQAHQLVSQAHLPQIDTNDIQQLANDVRMKKQPAQTKEKYGRGPGAHRGPNRNSENSSFFHKVRSWWQEKFSKS